MPRKFVVVSIAAVLGVAAGFTGAAWWAQTQGADDVSAAPASVTSTPAPERSPVPSPPAEPSPTPTASPSPTPPAEPEFSRHTYVLTFPSSPWVVVNKHRPLNPLDYEPEDLEPLTGVPGGADQRLRAEAAEDFLRLVEHAQEDGHTIRVTTAYRSYGFQQTLFDGYVRERGRESAEHFSARPGFSEHQTGWAVDVFDTDACRLRVCFADSDTYAWIEDNAADYGFIVRYAEGKEDITGYRFEPWHLRWVGADLAQQMQLEDIATMEEFFDLAPAPDYRD